MRLVRAPYPATLMHELQLHAWNDVRADGRQYVVDLMDDAGALYEKVRKACANDLESREVVLCSRLAGDVSCNARTTLARCKRR